mmetsp:Transcript_21370/g.29741  ORF Transcript_21370/g.29741 Transcript_21370/m.29741 type:complete len:466 (-) Transcript_21370:248-1645(-)
MEPIQQDHEHFKSFRDSNHNFGDTMPVTNIQDYRSSSSMSSSSTSSSSPTTLPSDFSELHVQDQQQPPVSSTGFGGGLEALALACVASAAPSKLSTKPKTTTTKPPIHNKKTTTAASPSTLPDRSLALVGKKDQIVLPIENGETVVSTDEGATTNGNHINQSDVLCGRGGLTNHHAGNMFFRRLVRLKQEAYLLASKREKAGVARDIVDSIRQLQPPGRFLKKDAKNPNTWIEIGDRKAREKTSQALREGAPELREVVKSGTTKSSTASNKAGNTRKKSNPTSSTLTRSAPSQPPLQSSVVTTKQSTPTQLINESSSRSIQLPTSPAMTFNRARIVSDDSVVEWGYRNGVERVQQVVQDVAPPPRPQSLTQSAFMLPVCEDEDDSSQQRHLPPHLQPTTPFYYDRADLPSQTLYTSAAVHSTTAGSKRKSPTNCSVQECHTWESSSCTKNRGPRLKLFKSRLMDY